MRMTNNRTGKKGIVRIVDMCGHGGEPGNTMAEGTWPKGAAGLVAEGMEEASL